MESVTKWNFVLDRSLDKFIHCDKREGKCRCKCIGLLGGGGGLVAQLCLTLATPWTVAHQAPLSMGFSRQEQWSRLPISFSDWRGWIVATQMRNNGPDQVTAWRQKYAGSEDTWKAVWMGLHAYFKVEDEREIS